jgi:hypothetical protein
MNAGSYHDWINVHLVGMKQVMPLYVYSANYMHKIIYGVFARYKVVSMEWFLDQYFIQKSKD